ncbi:M42 family metallopeptidase [soil metagenome]
MSTFNLDLLKRLCDTPGISGREDAIRSIVLEELNGLVDSISVDAMGNVIGVKAGSGGPRVAISGHMDEIGFYVKHIDDKGFIRLQPVGGFDARVLVAQRVAVHGFAGDTFIGALQASSIPAFPPIPGEAKAPRMDDLFVDLGLPGDVVLKSVELGDQVTLDRQLVSNGETVMTKALDDRVGVFVAIEAMRRLGNHSAEITILASTQEEVGLRGATTAAYGIDAEINIAIDITPSRESPGRSPDQYVTTLGNGVALKIIDMSHIAHPLLNRHLRDIADEKGIPYQLEVLPHGGTDAAAMQRARAGSVATTLSIPTKYPHTVNEIASIADIEATIDLLVAYLEAAGSRDYAYPSR